MFCKEPLFYRLQTSLLCRVHSLRMAISLHEFLVMPYLTSISEHLDKIQTLSGNNR